MGRVMREASNPSSSRPATHVRRLDNDVASVSWRLHGFDHAGTCYGFETTGCGDRARVVVNGKPALELPRVVWDALLDAVALQRGDHAAKSTKKVVVEPARVGIAWDEAETEQLKAAWSAGSSIGELAELHQRSCGAIRSRLKLLGLIDVEATQGATAAEPLAH